MAPSHAKWQGIRIVPYMHKLNIIGYYPTDCSELMIDISTHTPTFLSMFKCLYLHNVKYLHHQSNSDGNIKAVEHGNHTEKREPLHFC